MKKILIVIPILLIIGISCFFIFKKDKEKSYKLSDISEDTKCLKDVCKNGTLLNIKVNDKEEIPFYVINDENSKITLITSKNIGNNVKWSTETECNMGPNRAIDYIKELTSNWDNIMSRDYTYHDENEFYVDTTHNMKARLLTYNEAYDLGCRHLENNSCPKYLYDDLSNSSGYWTSSTISKNYKESAWAIYKDGFLVQPSVAVSTYYGLRLVIEVDK